MIEELGNFIRYWFTIAGYALLGLFGIALVIFMFGGVVVGLMSLVSSEWTLEFPRWAGFIWGFLSVVTFVAVLSYEYE